jgi:hypothetical protein
MTVTITIDSTDVTAAANFLQEFLTDRIPDGDFTEGTALRDLTVQALASVVAFLRADATQIRQMQSLISVQAATGEDTQALSDAVTAILSNFFVTPKGGGYARGFAIGHSSQQVDIFIPTSTQFTYSQGLIFVVDSSDTLFISASELVPIVDATSAILDYEFRIPLVALATGTAYNVTPGLFAGFGRFNPFVTRVETTTTFSGGEGPETVAEVLARAPTAVSVRNLINNRSIVATLNDNFDNIDSILVVGMGDPEMQRDLVPGVAPNLKFHVGGCVDIYLRTALSETSFTGSVGALFERPDGLSLMFRDGSVSFATVLPGDIIRITAGLSVVPAEFLVVEKIGNDLVVSASSPFPVATDEAIPPTTVSYVIGRTGPNYNDVIADIGAIPYLTGSTSRRVFASGRVTLPGGPVFDVLDVAILNPAPAEASFKSPLDGYVHFQTQVNTLPTQPLTLPLSFRTIVHDPLFAQSSSQWMEVVVGPDDNLTRFDGYQLRVRYRTMSAFASIDNFVRGTRERVSAAYQLPRGHHPVVVSMSITYRLQTTATTLLDNTAIAQTVADYINAYDAAAQSIDVSTVIQLVKDTYPTIANIVPASPGLPILSITYVLRAPTGDVLTYETTDVVEVDPAKQVAGPSLMLDDLGVTSRTFRYVTTAADILVQQVTP